MVTPAEDHWLAVAEELGVRAITPYSMAIGGVQATFTAYFPHFGGSSGMITDPDWSVIKPHVDALLAAGFGYSCVSFGTGTDSEGLREVLVDWGWSGQPQDKPEWA